MSTTTALGIIPGRRPAELAEFRNAHGWSPSIWKRLMVHRGLIGPDAYVFSDDAALDRLWQTIEDMPTWQQIPTALTFNTGVIPMQAYTEAADLLDEFDRRLPAPEGHANHVPGMAALLRRGPEAPFFGVYGTSVSENPFDPWDVDRDEPGSGIPANDFYILPQHRQMALDLLSAR